MSGDLSTMMPLVKSGRLRALGVTSAKRSSVVPELPTIAESGVPGFEASGWFGILVPAATPPEIVTRLNAVIVKGIATADTREKLASLGGDVVGGTPAEFAAYMREELAKWGKVIRTIGLKPEQAS
jgi:tripartite-type tricarboxylate transporter receptor subunit TctC